MAFNFNGNTPKKILYNGLNVAKLIYNGVVVWMSKVLATIEGILPLTLTDCTGDDLVNYKIYGNTDVSKKSVGDLVTDTSDINYGKYKIPVLTNSHTTNIYLNKPLRRASKLPYGYTELEHIRSTGTQYIDTRYYPNNLTDVECKFMYNQINNNVISSVFGVRDTDNTVKQFLMSVYNGYLWIANGLNNTRIDNVSPLVNTEYILRITPQKAYWNGTEILTMTSSVANCPDYSMFMFGRNTRSGLASQFSGKIYYLKIYEAGVLVRNFIPCKNPSNVVGLYDTVNDVFYSNAGSGSFIAGAEVEPVYYTDYLDYENQKVVRNVDDNDKGIDTPVEESVVLPAVPTDEGTTVFDVGTDVIPSYAEVKYYTKSIENKTLKTSDNLVFITSDNKIFKLKKEE